MPRVARKTSYQFPTLHSEGNLLPDDLLQRVAAEDRSVPGINAEAYHLLPGEQLREAISRAWLRLQGVWTSFRAALDRLPPDDRATTLTRDKWLLPLLRELDYGRLVAARPVEIDGRSFPVSHAYQHSPIHLLGWRVDLDHRTEKTAGAASAPPHSLVQDLLNRSDAHLWALLSNGRTLRILRDNHSLVRQAYLEFDLEEMMTGEHFADFALLWLVCHQSRVEAEKPADCWLEKWFAHARDEGIRALDRLSGSVQRTIELLGQGFLRHRANAPLRAALESGKLSPDDYYRQLRRLAYRLIFVFVAEDRGLLLDRRAPEAARERYNRHYATTRLRRLAERRRGSAHGDLWQVLRFVFGKLYAGCPELALPALGSFLWSADATRDLDTAELTNEALLNALHALGRVEDERGVSYSVSWRSLASDELGSVYQSLLELRPRVHSEAGLFELVSAAGNERKSTGSYYTPVELVERLLDSALDPVVDSVTRGKPRDAAISALLDLKVCDPSCGSGHFLVAAARRIARRVATLRTGDDEPAPPAMQAALRDVVGRCLFGVDIKAMAVELCKVSLWMEALDPGKPLSFLDAHIQSGNALLGVSPALLKRGLPEKAFAGVLPGDDPDTMKALRKRDRDERKGNVKTLELFASQAPDASLASAHNAVLRDHATRVDQADDGDLSAFESKRSQFTAWQDSPEQRRAEFLADLWCATLVWPKQPDLLDATPTTAEWIHLLKHPENINAKTDVAVEQLRQQYGFFHWHLRFPQVFKPSPARPDETAKDACGWDGGFDVILGNPPWERVKLQEKEFFAERAPNIANADNAAARKSLLKALPDSDPILWAEWIAALRASDGESLVYRDSGRYPLCGRGDVNTFSIFAELDLQLLSPRGRAGFIVPTGLATDATTSPFIAHLVERSALASLISFENFGTTFAEVNNRQSFCLITLSAAPVPAMRFQFIVNQPEREVDLGPTEYALEPADFRLLNPNTLSCPTFRTHRDAEIVKAIYRRVPVLWREKTPNQPEQNPWGLSFRAMLHMANDSGLFRTRNDLQRDGWTLDGAIFSRSEERMLPLYEAKMAQHYDHRFASLIDGDPGTRPSRKFEGWYGVDTTNPEEFVTPRYWVPSTEAASRLEGRWSRGWLLGWRDICRSTDARTAVASLIPFAATGDTFLLALSEHDPVATQALYANLCSFVYDYVCRQKIGGTHFKYHVMKQTPVLQPSSYDVQCPWSPQTSLKNWLLPRVLELTYTAWDLEHFARDVGHDGPPFRWDEARRFLLRTELDAAFFHLYGINHDDAAWILDTFWVIRQKDEKAHGEYRTKRVILERHAAMAQAITSGIPYTSPLDPPPADPRLMHPPRAPGKRPWPLPPQPPEIVVAFDADPAAVQPAAEPARPKTPRKSGGKTKASGSATPDVNQAGYQLTPLEPPPQLGLAFGATPPAAPTPAPAYKLNPPAAPQIGLGLTRPPAPSATAAPSPPTVEPTPAPIPAAGETGKSLERPSVRTIEAALRKAGTPLSKADIIRVTNLTDDLVAQAIKILVKAGRVTTEGKSRGTRYTLA